MRADIYWVESPSPGRVAIMPRPRGGDWLSDELDSLKNQGVDTLVSLLEPAEELALQLTDEAQLCTANDITFRSFPIEDRACPPLNEKTRQLLHELVADTQAGLNIAVHCRMGIGRSGLVVASLLVLHGLTADEAFRRVEIARRLPVPDTAEQRAWVTEFARVQGLDVW